MRRRDINGKYISEWRLQSRLGTITKFLEQDLSTRDKIVNQKIITQIFQLQEQGSARVRDYDNLPYHKQKSRRKILLFRMKMTLSYDKFSNLPYISYYKNRTE